MNFDIFNIPDMDYGSWNFGLIAACIAAVFLFLYIMQGRIVDSIVAALVIGVIVSFIAVMFFHGEPIFWAKYLSITIGAPVVLAILLRSTPKMLGASKAIGSKKSSTVVGKRKPARQEDEWEQA
jgi:hypothetical protein